MDTAPYFPEDSTDERSLAPDDLLTRIQDKDATIGILEAEIVQMREMLTEAIRDSQMAAQQLDEVKQELSVLRLRYTALQDRMLQIHSDTAQGMSSTESLLAAELERAALAISRAQQTIHDLASLTLGPAALERAGKERAFSPLLSMLEHSVESIEETLTQTSGKIHP